MSGHFHLFVYGTLRGGDEAAAGLAALDAFADEQGQRLADKILQAGGLEPGRVRRTGGLA